MRCELLGITWLLLTIAMRTAYSVNALSGKEELTGTTSP